MIAVEEVWGRMEETVSLVLPAPWPGVGSGVVAGLAFWVLVMGLTKLHGFGRAGVVSPVVGLFVGVVGLVLLVLGDVYGVAGLRQLGVEPGAVARLRWVLPWAVLLLAVVPVTRWAFRANYWTSAGAWVIAGGLAGLVLWVGGRVVGPG